VDKDNVMIDLYCERLSPDFWAEPVNAFTNASFLIAAFALWRFAKQRKLLTSEAWILVTLAASIGIGSWLFHTFSTPWARLLDVLPILVFQIAVLWLYGGRIIKLNASYLIGFLALYIILTLYARQFPHLFNGSMIYAPALFSLALLSIYHFRHAKFEKHLLIWAVIVFLTSLTFRTIDLKTCEQTPFGTHFIWHLLNGLLVYLVARALLVNLDEYAPRWMHRFGRKQIPVWFDSSVSVTDDFQTIGKKLKILKFIPNPYPFYDLIMGFYERPSNREALRGPMLERARNIIDVGAGTGYLLGRLVEVTNENQKIIAVDLSQQMLDNSRSYLAKNEQLSDRIGFKKADCRNLPWDDNTFDLYVSSYLFDLLPEEELKEALTEMERILVPDGYAILITMTTELDDVPPLMRTLYRIMNEFYCLGYHKGRWNPIWRSLFAGYAPHCRPIALGKYLRETDNMILAYTKVSRVLLFPVRIYYVRKGHG
jgi:ubiquinone/menaquinone biosynthesis C-methylase UbiE